MLLHVPRRMIVVMLTDSTSHIIVTKAALLETEPETIGAEHFKLFLDRDTQMTRHKDVEARDNKNSRLDWRREV